MLFLQIIIVCFFFIAGDQQTGYVTNDYDGFSYKLMYQAKPWLEAKEVCALNGGKLAVPKSEEQFKFIQKLVRGMHYPSVTGTNFKLVVWLGINNLEDYRVWRNIDGEDIMQGFHQWTTENNGNGFSDDPREPHCAVLDAVNPGLRDFWCHRPQPYICERQP
ncbi:hypothetical protein K1T71_008504 [Dendrolimus kikuchii]|uniref:Uncharacterized protein n=1 Tax=Dendrolimus kikuchii TaxID=765133 RepID=A0ACC1CXX9_9NEOP|nr:hypothetical protein K1T71_008504 [Dendrolimus kikuchii]